VKKSESSQLVLAPARWKNYFFYILRTFSTLSKRCTAISWLCFST